jgi:hypothetical protein
VAATTLSGTTAQAAALARLTTNMPAITSMGATTSGSQMLLVLGEAGGRASVLNLATREQLGSVAEDGGPAITSITCAQIAGQPVAVLGRDGGSARLVSVPDGEAISTGSISDPLMQTRPAAASALIMVDGALMKISGDERGAAAVEHGDSRYLLPARHGGAVTAVVAAYLDGQPVAFTGGQDGVVMIWDLIDRRLIDVLAGFGPVFALWSGNGGATLLVGAGSEVIAFAHDRSADNAQRWTGVTRSRGARPS